MKRRALHQQKLNEFKKKARNLQDYSEETQQLLNCFYNTDNPGQSSTTITVNKKDYDQRIYSYDEGCKEGDKAIKVEYVICNEVPTIYTDRTCIPDIDTCPNDYAALVIAIDDALKSEGEDNTIFSWYAELLSIDTCAYPQCFAKPNKEFMSTIGYYEEHPPFSYSCPAIGGSCEVDCEDDNAFICIPGLCYGNKDYDEDYIPIGPDEKDVVPTHHKTSGNKRQLKATKAPKGTKAPKPTKAGKCTCKAPRNSIPI